MATSSGRRPSAKKKSAGGAAKRSPAKNAAARKPVPPTGLELVDALDDKRPVLLTDYVAAVSQYVKRQATLGVGPRKAAQIRLSNGLAEALLAELRNRVPSLSQNARAGEQRVSGALRVAQVDLLEFHPLDGLRLAVELKPVNLAVGRAIWNRFGDTRVTAVNLHLKFPFAVVGGVLAIPIYEVVKRRGGDVHKTTVPLISRAVERLVRAGGRLSEAEAAHLLEGVCVIAYDPETGKVDPDLPPKGSKLRWEGFLDALATAYQARFGSEISDESARLDTEAETAED